MIFLVRMFVTLVAGIFVLILKNDAFCSARYSAHFDDSFAVFSIEETEGGFFCLVSIFPFFFSYSSSFSLQLVCNPFFFSSFSQYSRSSNNADMPFIIAGYHDNLIVMETSFQFAVVFCFLPLFIESPPLH